MENILKSIMGGSWVWGTIQKEPPIILLIIYRIFIEHQSHNRFLYTLSFHRCIYSCYHHHNQDLERFHHSKKFPHAYLELPHPYTTTSVPWQLLMVFVTKDLVPSFLEFHVNGIIQYIFFCAWLLSFSIMLLRFIQFIVFINSSFLFIEYSIVLMHYKYKAKFSFL